MKKIISLGGKLVCLLLLFNFSLLFAQVPGGGSDPNDPNVPIDGGASLLAAAGVAYGLKKYRDNRKQQQEKSDEQ